MKIPMWPRALLFATPFCLPSIALAQLPDQSPYERVLIPIATDVVLRGANGSQWITLLAVRNDADEPVVVNGAVGPGDFCTSCAPIPSQSSAEFLHFGAMNPNGGRFLYVGKPGRGKVKFSFRIQDISRQSETWGTSIPVIREDDLFTGTVSLFDVPVAPAFRTSVRIYDFDGALQSTARVRAYEKNENRALVDRVVTLNRTEPIAGSFPHGPGAAFISDLVEAFPVLAAAKGPLRVTVDPVTPGLRIWAFASVTNNSTQHVTAIIPDHPTDGL